MLLGTIFKRLDIIVEFTVCKDFIDLKVEFLHIVCGANKEELWIITAYYPDNIKWEDNLKTRKEI